MKLPLLVIALFLFALIRLQAQVADRPTVSSAGYYFIFSSSLNFQSTIGEPIIQTIGSGGLKLTQGFQQPEQVVDIPIGNGGGLSEVVIYPNPAVDQVKIRFTLEAPAWISFALVNNGGQVVRTIAESLFQSGQQEVPFDFHVAGGIYLLIIQFEGKTISTKVIIE